MAPCPQIFPVLKNAWFPRSLVPAAAEAQMRGQDPDRILPVHRPFADGLVVCYEQRESNRRSMVTRAAMKALRLDEGALQTMAVQYLRHAVQGQVRVGRLSTFCVLQTGGAHEAACLLLPEVLDDLAAQVVGDLRVACPAADAVIFTGTETVATHQGMALTAEECLRVMAGSADRRFTEERHQGEPLSDLLYRRTDTGWESVGTLSQIARVAHC